MERFGTAGIRGDAETVSPELALAVGRALAADGDVFVVGRDGRRTGPGLAAALTAGLESGGATVFRVGTVPTPTLAYASRGRRGVMLTASHNPPGDNGIKCFVDGREYDRAAERRIEDRVDADPDAVGWRQWGDAESLSVTAEYRDAVVAYAAGHGADPDGLTVAVDCGNGMASLAVPQTLTDLGADVIALNANIDGEFVARESKPTADSLSDLRAFVADDEDVALGIGHDGDADRIVVVDAEGHVVHEDTVLAMLAEHYTRESDADDPVVVTTPNASGRIDERVDAAGGRVERVRLGALHEGVADARDSGADGTRVAFAAEPWKHVHPAFGDWIDGVVSAAVLVRLVAAAGLDGLRDPIAERPYRKESVGCPDDRKARAMDRVETELPEAFPEASADTEHGVRLDFPDGSWVLVRPSGTEPYLRVYAESEWIDDLVETAIDAVERCIEATAR